MESYCLMGIEFQLKKNEIIMEMNGVMVAQHCECVQRRWTVHLEMVQMLHFFLYVLITIKKKRIGKKKREKKEECFSPGMLDKALFPFHPSSFRVKLKWRHLQGLAVCAVDCPHSSGRAISDWSFHRGVCGGFRVWLYNIKLTFKPFTLWRRQWRWLPRALLL